MMCRESHRPLLALPALLCFLLAVTAMAYHHHDTSFQLPTCSICKLKTSLTGGTAKFGADAVVSGAGCTGPVGIAPSFAGYVSAEHSVTLAYLPPHPHSNKAPPAQS